MKYSPPHDFCHWGLHFPVPFGIWTTLWHGGACRRTKFADLVVSVMDNNRRRIKLKDTVVNVGEYK